jgi:hypothetical protein
MKWVEPTVAIVVIVVFGSIGALALFIEIAELVTVAADCIK